MQGTASPQTRQAMYVLRYSECVFVASGIQHAMCILHTVICGMPGSKIFSALSHKRHDSQEVTEHKMCFDFTHYNFCLKHPSFFM